MVNLVNLKYSNKRISIKSPFQWSFQRNVIKENPFSSDSSYIMEVYVILQIQINLEGFFVDINHDL